MRINDTLTLAFAKFKTKKVRSILSALAAGITLTVLICASFFTNSIIDAVRESSTNTGRNLIKTNKYDYSVNGDGSPVDYGREPDYRVVNTIQRLTAINDKPFEIISGNTTFGGDYSLKSISDELFTDFTQSSIDVDDDDVPIVLSSDVIISLEGVRLDELDASERVDKVNQLQSQYLGKEVTLGVVNFVSADGDIVEFRGDDTETPTTEITALVVGFSPGTSELFGMYEAANYIPESVARSHPGLVDNDVFIFEDNGSASDQEAYFIFEEYLYSFSSESERTQFVQEFCPGFEKSAVQTNCSYFNEPLAMIQQQTEGFKSFIRYVVIFLALVVATSMFVTVSKIIGDSERETGVFRAIGAKRLHIVQIYITYSTILAVIAFVCALIIAIGIMLIATGRFGDSFGYQIAAMTTNYAEVNSVTLISFNLKEMIQIMLIGIVAASVGTIVPLLRLVMKDPIKAMRSD